MKNITILGATGSIGTQALDVLRQQKEDFKLTAISAYSSLDKVKGIIAEFKPEYAVMMDFNAYKELEEFCKGTKESTKVLFGIEGLIEISTISKVDIVLTAVVGMIGIMPVIAAIRAGKDIAIANKETLVAAGELVMKEAKDNNVKILPVDSEHGAIFQCIQGNDNRSISKLILTASGGPFRGKKLDELRMVSKEEALKHPKWNMGNKISIDSATLMNKGLEVIEAHWLFSQSYDNIEVLIHPQSIIHSMVEYIDGSVIAQLSNPDMRLPIQYALNYPERKNTAIKPLEFHKIRTLTFEEPDYDNFPSLKLAFEAGKRGNLAAAIMNCANEVAVNLYLKDMINFGQIYEVTEEALTKFDSNIILSLDNILSMEKEVTDYILKKYFRR